MKKKLTTVEFRGTKEQEAKLVAAIAAHKGEKGSMMPILQEAQEIYGYLPVEVQEIIARETGAPVEEIYGIATFYSQFKLNPDGKYAIAVCLCLLFIIFPLLFDFIFILFPFLLL